MFNRHLNVKAIVCILVVFCICTNVFCLSGFCAKKKKKEKPVNNSPKTYEEYLQRTPDIKVFDMNIPPITLPDDPQLVNKPKPVLFLTKYNYPPGTRTNDLRKLRQDSHQLGLGVSTASGDKLAYTELYYDKTNKRVSSEIYTIYNDEAKDIYNFLMKANVATRMSEPIITSGFPIASFGQQNILTIIDWSSDGQKLAVKETIGDTSDGIWKTNIIVFNYNDNSQKELSELRYAITNWWQHNKNLNLNDFMWDIYPLGWTNNKIIVVAYAEKKQKRPLFLGEWAIDYTGENPVMLSETEITSQIESNGITLKIDKRY